MHDVHGKNKSAIIVRSNNNDIAPTLLITTALPLTPRTWASICPNSYTHIAVVVASYFHSRYVNIRHINRDSI